MGISQEAVEIVRKRIAELRSHKSHNETKLSGLLVEITQLRDELGDDVLGDDEQDDDFDISDSGILAAMGALSTLKKRKKKKNKEILKDLDRSITSL